METFRDYQCPSACIDKAEHCYTDEYERCNKLCGNYNEAPGISRAGCTCVMMRTVPGYPDECLGQTILSGYVAGMRGVKHSCTLIPDDCKNHRATTCGFYKHCAVDVCPVLNVSCPEMDSCQTDGTCGKADGRCYYQPKAEGQACDDGLFYTHGDTCTNGRCTGVINKCQRDNVTCATGNPCLSVTDKVATGHCVFEQLPWGTPCASHATPGAGATLDGQCQYGLCRRSASALDLCFNVTCQRPSPCHEVPPCNPDSGCGVAPLRPDGSACDDDDAGTQGDKCIEGRCVGDAVPQPTFRELGDCSGQRPQSGGLLLPWRRYSADVADLQHCKDQCGADPECRAFSYGYQTCSVFGTARQTDLDPGSWGRPWVLETAPSQPQYAVACYEKNGDSFWQAITETEQALLVLSICVVLIVPLTWGVIMLRHVLRGSLVQLLYGRQHQEAMGGSTGAPPSPAGGGAKVAAAPGAIVEYPSEV
eukprot:CAMPEP_0175453662 /NCGR_PEP_ID=MMETSP0095-20121207/64070_1 /TAXON_ID=311494 /ORGANISM="Alexandrium monilatum, Strain CCMP3105" /LENGTH=476 /DNA_ID=CAMNT_0016754311 /DNA_START=260 /DNA_END=1687 /DNA_ORIENTATION=-